MKPNKRVNSTSYGSPENNSGRGIYNPPVFYGTPEAKTPDPNVSATTYGNIPTINEQSTYGMSRPTADQAAGIDPISQADKTDYSSWTQQGGQPQSPYNTDTAAVMPKLQVQGDPAEVYGVGHDKIGSPRAEDQTNIDPRQQSSAKIPNPRG